MTDSVKLSAFNQFNTSKPTTLNDSNPVTNKNTEVKNIQQKSDEFIKRNKKKIIAFSAIGAIGALAGLYALAKSGKLGNKLKNFIDNLFKKSSSAGSDKNFEIFNTKELKKTDIVEWSKKNSANKELETYLLYGTEGEMKAGKDEKITKSIIEHLKENGVFETASENSISGKHNDFIVQLLYDDNAKTSQKFRIITFDSIEKELNKIFEENKFFSNGIIKLT